jgi:hypothetical protein
MLTTALYPPHEYHSADIVAARDAVVPNLRDYRDVTAARDTTRLIDTAIPMDFARGGFDRVSRHLGEFDVRAGVVAYPDRYEPALLVRDGPMTYAGIICKDNGAGWNEYAVFEGPNPINPGQTPGALWAIVTVLDPDMPLTIVNRADRAAWAKLIEPSSSDPAKFIARVFPSRQMI